MTDYNGNHVTIPLITDSGRQLTGRHLISGECVCGGGGGGGGQGDGGVPAWWWGWGG